MANRSRGMWFLCSAYAILILWSVWIEANNLEKSGGSCRNVIDLPASSDPNHENQQFGNWLFIHLNLAAIVYIRISNKTATQNAGLFLRLISWLKEISSKQRAHKAHRKQYIKVVKLKSSTSQTSYHWNVILFQCILAFNEQKKIPLRLHQKTDNGICNVPNFVQQFLFPFGAVYRIAKVFYKCK